MRHHLYMLLLTAAAACDRNASAPPSSDTPSTSESQLPAQHPPIAPQEAAPGPASTGAPEAGGLTWSAPKPFVSQAPKSSMRAAQYGIEGEEKAELTVFYFGPGQGGAIEPNLVRWVSQFTQPDGSNSNGKEHRTERTVGGISVTLVDVVGTYNGGMAMPGAAPAAPEADSMLLGAIASGPSGPVFFKLVGPRKAIEAARPAFDALVDSLHPASH